MESICFVWLKKSQIIVNGDDFYASVLQKIISKNLSKCLYNLLYHKNPVVKNDDVFVHWR